MRSPSALACVVCLVVTTLPAAQAGRDRQESRSAASDAGGVALTRQAPVTGSLRPGDAAAFSVAATADTFLRVEVEGRGMRMRVSARAPNGGAVPSLIDEARVRTGGDRTPVVWSIVIAQDGPFVVRLESLETESERPYAVRLTEQRPSVTADEPRVLAERLLEAAGADRVASTRQAVESAERANDVALHARALLRLGTLLADAGQSAEAERALVTARERCRSTPDVACTADAELALGRLLASTGRPEPGLAAFEASRTAAAARRDDAGVADALAERGGVEIALTRQDRARATLTEAADVARAAGHRRAEADALNMLGILLANVGEAELSETHYRTALALRLAMGDEVGAAQTTSNLGALANALGDYRRGLDYFDDALATRRRLGLAQATANTLHNLGVAQANLGALETALGHLDEALAIWQRTGGRRGEAFALQELGQTYARLGDRRRALDHWTRALPLWNALGDRRGEVQTMLFAAAAEADGRVPDAAAARYAAALDLARAGQLRREWGLALLGLAGLARERGDLSLAERQAREALGLFETIGNRRERGRALAEIGEVHVDAGRLADGHTTLQEALTLLESVEDRAEAARVGMALADVAGRRGEAAAAVEAIAHALDRVESVRRDQQAESLNLSVFASDRPLYDQAIAILMRLHGVSPTAGLDAQALHVSERRRARRLLDMVAAPASSEPADAATDLVVELRQTEERIGAKAARLTRMLSEASPAATRIERARDELRDLVERADRVRAEIRRRHRAPVSDPAILDLAAVQATLDTRTVLLEFALGERDGFAWAVTSTGITPFTVPGRAGLSPLAQRFGASVSGRGRAPSAAPDDSGRRLSAALLAPASIALIGKTRLVLVGDGLLDAVPIAALPHPTRRGVLGDHVQVETVPSASVAAALRARRAARPPAPPRVAVFADPVYSPGDGRLPAARRSSPSGAPDLLRLRFSREEARAIATRAPGRATLFLDFDATRQRALDGSLAGYRYLHWASHARIDEAVPQLSTIDLSRVDARGRGVDGALRLRDVYGLSLNADLVVLSACGTALGAPIAGEGLVGLASGFLRAGADRVLASLWDVDDRAAAAFMTRFYEALLTDRRTPEQALASAQRAMRSDPAWQASRDWAAWVLIGPGSPPSAEGSGGAATVPSPRRDERAGRIAPGGATRGSRRH